MSFSLLFLAVSFPFGGPDGVFLFGLYGFYFIALAVLHLAMSSAVYSDACRLKTHLRSGTFLVGPGMWWLATLLGGMVAVAIYWLIHHSRLRPAWPPKETSTREPI